MGKRCSRCWQNRLKHGTRLRSRRDMSFQIENALEPAPPDVPHVPPLVDALTVQWEQAEQRRREIAFQNIQRNAQRQRSKQLLSERIPLPYDLQRLAVQYLVNA